MLGIKHHTNQQKISHYILALATCVVTGNARSAGVSLRWILNKGHILTEPIPSTSCWPPLTPPLGRRADEKWDQYVAVFSEPTGLPQGDDFALTGR